MGDVIKMEIRLESPQVSPYLLRPLRSYEEALADIAARKSIGGMRAVHVREDRTRPIRLHAA